MKCEKKNAKNKNIFTKLLKFLDINAKSFERKNQAYLAAIFKACHQTKIRNSLKNTNWSKINIEIQFFCDTLFYSAELAVIREVIDEKIMEYSSFNFRYFKKFNDQIDIFMLLFIWKWTKHVMWFFY